MKRYLTGLCVLLASSLSTLAGTSQSGRGTTWDAEPNDASRKRTVPIRVFLPPGTAQCPVVIFSHGLGGSRTGNDFLGEAWSQAGFVSVFLQHPGSDESLWKGKQLREGLADLAAGATGEQLRERVKDVGFVLDQLAQWNTSQGHALERRLDLTRIAMSGHSFGAVTTETIMATAPRDRSKWKISACIIMSPSPFAAFASDQAFGKIDIPVLCMTGTEDENPLNRDQPPSTRLEVYKHLPPGRKYQVVFDGGNHGIFSGHQLRFRERAPRFHPAITRLTVEFLKSALLADSTSAKWLASEAPKREGVLAPGDAWMWK